MQTIIETHLAPLKDGGTATQFHRQPSGDVQIYKCGEKGDGFKKYSTIPRVNADKFQLVGSVERQRIPELIEFLKGCL
jgi:hypothetical protein